MQPGSVPCRCGTARPAKDSTRESKAEKTTRHKFVLLLLFMYSSDTHTHTHTSMLADLKSQLHAFSLSVSHPAVRRLFPALCNLFILHVLTQTPGCFGLRLHHHHRRCFNYSSIRAEGLGSGQRSHSPPRGEFDLTGVCD